MAEETTNPVKTIYLHLTDRAMEGETVSYPELATLVGLPTSGNYMSSQLSKHLAAIMHHCQRNGLPILPSIVVKKSGPLKEIPGNGFWTEIGLKEMGVEDRRIHTERFHRGVFSFYEGLFDNG